MVIKGGMIAWSVMGDPNASIPNVEPVLYRPMFGAHPDVIPQTCLTFLSQAAIDAGIPRQLGLRRSAVPVGGCRTIGKRDMVRNDALPRIEVNPETYEVRLDGELAESAPVAELALAQKYFVV
jgi:urease alpha subunit